MHTAWTLPALSPIRFVHFAMDAAVMFVLAERAYKKETERNRYQNGMPLF
jgi:hypothetical protein